MGQSVSIPEGKLDIIIEGIESDLKSLATRLHEHIIVFCIVWASKDCENILMDQKDPNPAKEKKFRRAS